MRPQKTLWNQWLWGTDRGPRKSEKQLSSKNHYHHMYFILVQRYLEVPKATGNHKGYYKIRTLSPSLYLQPNNDRWVMKKKKWQMRNYLETVTSITPSLCSWKPQWIQLITSKHSRCELWEGNILFLFQWVFIELQIRETQWTGRLTNG